MGCCKNCYHQPLVLGCSQDVPSSTIIIWMSYIPISLSQLLVSPSFSSHPHPLQSSKSPEQPLYCFTTLVQSIAYQTILALAYLHDETRKITYQDIKPNNILLTPDGCIKLIDFGILCMESKVESIHGLDLPDCIWPEHHEKMYFDVSTGCVSILFPFSHCLNVANLIIL